MKILQLCKKFPYPQKDGESIAIANLSKSLVELGCEVHLLAMNTSRHYVRLDDVQDETSHYQKVYAVEVDNRLKPFDALQNLIKGNSYHVCRFESAHFEKNLKKLLSQEDYDVIQLETMYLAPYLDIIRKHSKAIVAMRAHNVEHEIWERITENTSFLPKKWYLSKLTRQLRDYEVGNLNRYDILVAISDEDLKKFKTLGYRNGAVSTPVGLDLSAYNNKEQEPESKTTLSFIGSLDWQPNLEGLKWYLKYIAPKVKGAELHIAGRNTPDEVYAFSRNDNITVHGEVPDAINFIARHDIMIVPLLSGSGMRVKILEGMAMSKTVITTSKGMEGIDAVDGHNILVADDPESFATKVNWAIKNKDANRKIGENAREFVEDHYNAKDVAKKLLKTYEYVLTQDYVTHS
ncbi:MAG: glycosyltransferase family 4 protein [Saprospiraceae bacterium]|nr:glycosyltransferase family 4 protein [Saprospiraceae bacterium]